MTYGTALRRFTDHKPHGAPKTLSPMHPAVVNATTQYPAMRVHPSVEPRLLKSGAHNRKIGKKVVKGPWAGMPVYTLTLEERATCPRACIHWRDCFGNKMNWSPRIMHGDALVNRLNNEIGFYAAKHRKGFVVRLHVLGDFYCLDYAAFWASAVLACQALHVFGYTAWGPETEIGSYIAHARSELGQRFAIRHSNANATEWATRTIYREPEASRIPEGIVCPAQTDKTECCSTCGLCWQTKENIVFLAH